MDAVARRVRHKAFVGRYACVPPHPPRMLATTGACYRKSATSRSRSIRTRPDSMSPKGPAPRGWGAETDAGPRAPPRPGPGLHPFSKGLPPAFLRVFLTPRGRLGAGAHVS